MFLLTYWICRILLSDSRLPLFPVLCFAISYLIVVIVLICSFFRCELKNAGHYLLNTLATLNLFHVLKFFLLATFQINFELQ